MDIDIYRQNSFMILELYGNIKQDINAVRNIIAQLDDVSKFKGIY